MGRLNETAAQRVRLLRRVLGLNQITFAKFLGVTHSTISQIEGGHRDLPIRIAGKIREKTGVTADWLWWGDSRGMPYQLICDLQAATEKARLEAVPEIEALDTPGKRVHWALQQRGISGSALATHLGIARQSVNQWRKYTAALPDRHFHRIAQFLNCSELWLRNGEGPPLKRDLQAGGEKGRTEAGPSATSPAAEEARTEGGSSATASRTTRE
jgi:transcriptional regulator with XRE-family HTH domain